MAENFWSSAKGKHFCYSAPDEKFPGFLTENFADYSSKTYQSGEKRLLIGQIGKLLPSKFLTSTVVYNFDSTDAKI
jgi:hypothetical protein